MTNINCISIEEVKQKTQAEAVFLADVRQAEDFQQSHIENAQALDQFNFLRFVEEMDKTASIIVYCYHGVTSKNIASYLLNHGFEKVYSMDGGFAAWCEAGYPISLNEGEIA